MAEIFISFYGAEAYANWLGMRLPTEREWLRAAGGAEGFSWPWSDVFDADKCNSVEAGILELTPVNNYPEGRSPEGCCDMSGNIWEWTVDYYDDKREARGLRGGLSSSIKIG